MQRLLLKLVC